MNRKLYLTIVVVLFMTLPSHAQNFINAYTNKTLNSSNGSIDRIAADNMNNVINATMYSGTITVGNYTFPSGGILSTLIVKKDENDSVVWAKSLSCGTVVIVGGLYTDQQSNIYVTGYFGDSLNATTLNCDPFPISIPNGYNSFVIKYAPNGTVLWSNTIKISTGNAASNADVFKITGNGTNRIALSSFFYNVPPQTIGTTTISPNNGNLFYAVIDDNGNWQHATLLGGTSLHLSISLVMAANEDVFIGGDFRGVLNLGSAGTLTTLTSSPQDFICKANASGSFVWAKMLESSSWWRTEVLTQNNDVYLMGTFSGTITLGSTPLTASSYSTYLTKIDNAGNYLWAKKYGTNESHFYCATKNNNRLYLCGYTSPYVANNQFDTLNMVYATSLPPSHTFSCICYLIEVDLNGNALKGAAYSFNFATLNTQSMACTGSRVYLTGNVGSKAAFGGYVLTSNQINASNYVAQYTDSANIISGISYYDLNSNATFDAGDVPCDTKLKLTKGSNSLTTMINGPYKIGVDKGTYLSSITDAPLYYTYTPATYTSVFSNLTNQIDSLNDFAFQPIAGQNDLVIDMVLGQLRPGFTGIAHATLKNIGTTPKSGTMSLALNHPDIDISSCIPAAISMAGNNATLAYNLNPTEQISYIIEYTVAVSAPLGSAVLAYVSAPDITDITPSNNSDTIHTLITGSFDPNSKDVYPRGNISPAFISHGDPLEYTIHFQNTGNDTAFTVILADTLSQKLDPNSFQLTSSSHHVTVDLSGNMVWFRFYHINLVDSLHNEPLSHGYVKYSIKPMGSCVLGDIITNKAYIYFDYNTPIVTNTTSTLIDNGLYVGENSDNDIFSIFPNPANTSLHIQTNINGNHFIRIYDLQGKLWLEQSLITPNSVVDIIQLPVGAYFVVLTDEKDNVAKSFIKID